MAPRYERPVAPIATAFPVATADTVEQRRIADIGWHEFFPLPQLQRLITSALEHNRDLQLATLNVASARAQYRIQESALFPTNNGNVDFTRSRTSADLSPGGTSVTSNRFEVGLGVTAYELDFFGRVRSLKDSALAAYLATKEAQTAARISIIAEVARGYVGERAASEQLTLASNTLTARIDALGLVRKRFDAGIASITDVTLAETLVESARVSVATFTRLQLQAVNALTLLVGNEIGELPLPPPLAAVSPMVEIPLGIPASLLESRPDIRAAEQRLLAANADIGAARAAFFPRISLTGAIGTASPELSSLFDGENRTWTFMPQLVLPIFTWGAHRANLDLATVRKDQAVATYEKTIQIAFREVADALVARKPIEDQVQAQTRLRATQAIRLTLAEQRYSSGVEGYLVVLDAKRDLFDAEQALVQAHQLRLLNAIDLYKALGGGISD